MDKKKIGGDGSLEDSYIQGVVTISEIATILGMVIVLEIVTVSRRDGDLYSLVTILWMISILGMVSFLGMVF